MAWFWITAEQMRTTAPAADLLADSTVLVNGGSETVLWGRAYRTGPGVIRQAAGEFAATALAAARVALSPGSAAGHQIRVLGDGMLAHLIRAALDAESATAVPIATSARNPSSSTAPAR